MPRFLLRQAGHPSGWLAGPIALLFNRSNALENAAAIEALELRPDHAAIEAGRLAVSEGAAEALPFADATFDGVLTVNTVYFWPDLARGAREIRRVLRPGGRFVASCVDPVLLGRIGFRDMGYRVEPPDVYAEAFRASFATVEVRATGDRKGTHLIVAS